MNTNKRYVKFRNFIKDNYKFILFYIAFVLFLVVPLPFYIFTSGGTIDINDRVNIDNEYKSDGSLNLAYVNQMNATIPTYLLSFIIPSWDVEKVSEETLNDKEDVSDILTRDKLYLSMANSTAVNVAYTLANKKIDVRRIHNKVFYVDGKAKTDLKVGDEITEADGITINNISEYKNIIDSKNIGDKIDLVVESDNKKSNRYIYIKDFKGEKLTGISVGTSYEYTTDPKVNINFKSGEAGPSGGFMTSLAIYNKLIKEDLTHGLKVVGTGTISSDGAVGEIGGVKYKLAGAEKENADIFFAPTGNNYRECIRLKKKHNYKIKVIEAKNIKDAIKYLTNLK